MKKGKNEQSTIEELIAEILLPMSEVIVKKDREGRVSIFKEGIKFGMIQNESLHLLDSNGEYQKVKREIFSDADSLLQEATRSFWQACGKLNFEMNS
jgi:hypothetical protein